MSDNQSSHSPAGRARVDGNLRSGGRETGRVTDGNGDRSARSDVDGPGQRGTSLLVEALEGVADLTALGDSWEVRGSSTGPGDLDWLTLDQGGRGVDGERRLGQSNTSGGECGEREGGGGELHLCYSDGRRSV